MVRPLVDMAALRFPVCTAAVLLLVGGCQRVRVPSVNDAADLGMAAPPADGGGVAVGDASQATVDFATADTRLFPLAVGYTWTFDVQNHGTQPSPCAEGHHDQRVVMQQTLGGRDAFAVSSYCSATTGSLYYSLDAQELDLFWESDGQWHLDLDLTLQAGRSWSNGTGTEVWASEGTVTVPAGTFHDCWRATKQAAYDAYTVYCPGAGEVHTHLANSATGNAWDFILVAKSF